MGFSLVYRTMGLVNFAHGNVVMIGAYLVSTFYLTLALPFALAVIIAMLVTGLIGVVIERVLRPLENKDFDLMLIGTIGFGIVLEALALSSGAPPEPRSATRSRWPRSTSSASESAPTTLVVLTIAAAGDGDAGAFPAAHEAWGRDASGRDGPRSSHCGRHSRRPQQRHRLRHRRRPGRPRRRLVGPLLYVSPAMGGSLGIKGFAGAILGGFGSIPGAIIGGLAIGVLDSFTAGHFQGYSELVTFLVFTIVIMIRPTGIFGERTVNRA
jgi:branched-chain amino acid transport system permease protein